MVSLILQIINIYEISKVYDSKYNEENKICGLMSGKYLENTWNGSNEVDFYLVKGIVEDLLIYMGYENRYSFVVKELPEEMHPTKSAYISVSGKVVGLFGQVHPRITKDEIYVIEINLDTLFENKTGKIKFKEFSKYPGIKYSAKNSPISSKSDFGLIPLCPPVIPFNFFISPA